MSAHGDGAMLKHTNAVQLTDVREQKNGTTASRKVVRPSVGLGTSGDFTSVT